MRDFTTTARQPRTTAGRIEDPRVIRAAKRAIDCGHDCSHDGELEVRTAQPSGDGAARSDSASDDNGVRN
jgi:hypothetical protein